MKHFSLWFSALVVLWVGTASATVWFTDASDVSVWARDAIEITTDKNIFTGYPDGTIRPKNPVNRAELLTIIARTKRIEFPDASTMASPFTDVPRSVWYRNSVIYAHDEGWIEGYADGTFGGAKNINWAEFVVLMGRAFDIEEMDAMYSDVPADAWFNGAAGAFQQGRMTRKLQGEFMPNNNVTREEVAYAIAKLLEKPSTSAVVIEPEEETIDLYRVAYRPRIDIGIEGYDVDRNALHVEIQDYSAEQRIHIQKDSDWTNAGEFTVTNKQGFAGEISTVEVKILFENDSAGPSDRFIARMTDAATGDTYEQEFTRGGEAFWSGLQKPIADEQSLTFTVDIKPKNDVTFATENSNLIAYVSVLEGFMHKPGQRYIGAPVEFSGRNLRPMYFVGDETSAEETIADTIAESNIPPFNSSIRAAYGEWSLRDVYEGATYYDQADCVGLRHGKVHGEDTLSTLIVDAGVFRDITIDAYQPEYVYALEQKLSMHVMETDGESVKLLTNYACHVSPTVDVVAGFIHPTWRNVPQYEAIEGIQNADKRLYVVTPNTVHEFAGITIMDALVTSDASYPCTGSYDSDSNLAQWKCLTNRALDANSTPFSEYKVYTIDLMTSTITEENITETDSI